MQCPACAADNPAENRFCDSCGQPLESRCGSCGARGRPGARFCGQCGAAVEPVTAGHIGLPTDAPAMAVASSPGRAARAAIDGERRRVTVLFADMESSTALAEQLDPEDVHRIMNQCFGCITDAVHNLEGTINQYTGDGVMALFGAPTALEDGPRRAVQAALDIQRSLRDYNRTLEAERGLSVQMRIGVHTGVVVVGRNGDDPRMDYTAMGDTTTLAARLQQVAEPGTVLISGATRHLVADHFETVDLGEVQLQGHHAPVHAFHVVRPRPRRARLQAAAERGLTPSVGRERELATLVELFDEAKQGRGQVVFVAGDAGIGKSRLVYELRRELALAGEDASWLEGRCVSFAQTIPLLPVIEQLREYCDIEESDGEEDVVGKLDAAAERLGELDAQLPYLRYLLAVDPGDPAVAAMDAAARRARVFEALRSFSLRVVQQRPAVFVVEDLHWIDSSTADYLAAALAMVASARILVILTYRVGYTPPLGAHSYFTTLTLRSLSAAETLAMAGGVLGTSALPAELPAALTEKAEGVPLFIEETIKALLDVGVLQRRADGYQLVKSVAEVAIPDTIEGVIMARLDRLGDAGKRTVQLAAVIGRHFLKRLLERIAELPTQLDGLLTELKRVEIIFEQGLLPEPAYVFKHAILQDVAYRSLSVQRRRELHRAVGNAIEELYADRLAEHYGELAHHFVHGELWAKAMHYSAEAGRRAADAYANAEAADHFARALHAAEHMQPPPDGATLASLHAERGALLNILADYEAGITHYEHALALLRAGSDRRAEVETLLAVSDLYLNYHRPEPAQRYCDEALELATALDDRALQAACLATRALYISAWHGPIAAARSAGRSALEFAQQLSDDSLRSRTLILLGSVLQWRADFDACVPHLIEGAHLAEHLHAGHLRGQALFQLGNAHLSTGRYDTALRWYAELRRYAASANDKFWIVRAPNLVGGVHLELYDFEAAIALCQEGDEIAQRLFPWPEPRGHCLVKLGQAQLLRGEYGAADEFLSRAWELLDLDSWGRWRWHIPLLRTRGELALATGRLEDAWSFASQSLELAAQTDSRKHVAHAKLVLGQIADAQDRLPEAEKLLRNAVTLADHIHAARELWLADSALGRTLARMGRDRDAETYLTQAAQTIEAIAASVGDPTLRASFVRNDMVADVYRRLGHRPLP